MMTGWKFLSMIIFTILKQFEGPAVMQDTCTCLDVHCKTFKVKILLFCVRSSGCLKFYLIQSNHPKLHLIWWNFWKRSLVCEPLKSSETQEWETTIMGAFVWERGIWIKCESHPNQLLFAYLSNLTEDYIIVGSCRTSVTYVISLQGWHLSKARGTVGAGHEHVRLRGSWLYICT